MEDSDDEFGLDAETEAAMMEAEAGMRNARSTRTHSLMSLQTWTTS